MMIPYIFSDKNKPIVQMLASEEITDENLDKIELEIEKKMFWFQRKLSKLVTNLQANLRVYPTHTSSSEPEFQMLVSLEMTVEQLAKAVGKVGRRNKEIHKCCFQKHNSIKGTSRTDWENFKITTLPDDLINDRNETLMELSLYDSSPIWCKWEN